MKRYTIIFTALFLCILPATQVQAQSETNINNKNNAPTINVTKLEITDKTLKLSYEIKSHSEDDIWILVGNEINKEFVMNAEIFMDEDDKTLTIRRRFALQKSFYGVSFCGIYVRLRKGESQTESILAKIPVQPVSKFRRPKRQRQGLEHATRLKIELGYYPGNLPEIMFKRYEDDEEEIRRIKKAKNLKYLTEFRGLTGGIWTPNSLNEGLISRDEVYLVSEPPYPFKGEQVLSTAVDNLHIPYIEKRDHTIKSKPPDLTSCTKAKIQYQPSMLEYFFPFAFQQNLLSSEEMEYLLSENILVVEDPKKLEAIAHDISKLEGVYTKFGLYASSRLTRYRSMVNVVCFYDNKPPVSFSIMNNDTIVIDGDGLACPKGFPSLKTLAPEAHIQEIYLRTQCAANLKDLWYRLRFYNMVEEKRLKNPSFRKETTYLKPSEWCDAMLQPFNPMIDLLPLLVESKWDEKTHICPSAGGGKNNYAMNPNCKPDSPSDMVLLFETKAGWNQHGGPELFTFDNHEPKGGCVLLNDGTVKFIRTTEELQQLRWK